MREGWSLELGGFPPQKPKGRGRPSIKGKPHKKLSALIKDRKVSWKRYRVSLWYGRTNCLVDIASGTALWYRSGVPPVPIRWLLVRDPKGELEPQAFLATNLNARPCDILAWFVSRWQVEVTFAEVRAHLGVEPSVSGPTRRSFAPRRSCLDYSQSSPSGHTTSPNHESSSREPLHGIQKRS